jgi:hypothetical protein
VRLPAVIEHFAADEPYVVQRAAQGSYVDGVFVPGTSSTLSIRAAVQPLTGRDLLELPEGHHASEVRLVFTTTELRSLSPDSAADIVVIDGINWRVVEVSRWDFDGDTHYRAMVSKRSA